MCHSQQSSSAHSTHVLAPPSNATFLLALTELPSLLPRVPNTSLLTSIGRSLNFAAGRVRGLANAGAGTGRKGVCNAGGLDVDVDAEADAGPGVGTGAGDEASIVAGPSGVFIRRGVDDGEAKSCWEKRLRLGVLKGEPSPPARDMAVGWRLRRSAASVSDVGVGYSKAAIMG